MPFVLSKTVFKRLCLLPLLFIIIILFFYKQIINLYHGVEYNGNVTVAKSAFDLFKRQPVNICHHIDLLNVGSPDFVGDVGSAYYPQVVCTDPGFGIKVNACLILVISTEKDRSFERIADQQMGCQVHSFAPSELHHHQHNTSIHYELLEMSDVESSVSQSVRKVDGIIDYVLIRTDSWPKSRAPKIRMDEWHILAGLKGERDRIKQLSIGVNLCPVEEDDEDDSDGRFGEKHFQGLLDADQQLTDYGWELFDVANDKETFAYNPIVKEKTFCASQWTWLNQRFRITSSLNNATVY